MFQSLSVFQTAMGLARHAGQAQTLSAQNIANADTPGYAAMALPDFAETLSGMPAPGLRATRAGHLLGDASGTTQPYARDAEREPNGNSVSLESEMIHAIDAKRDHGRALAIYKSSITLLRASLGR